ncbi:hypothetical protein [Pontibacter beigongshangensis]|uniref:hypothetical protein n=1 Tax=Pontibacter beigongshangensis TaxID=2574733 RepID=UPI00164F2028|nr:hypothetical protein [Pontibacter beigongshangensis]
MNKATIWYYSAVGVSAFVYLALGYFISWQAYGQQLMLSAIIFVAYVAIAQHKTNVRTGIGAAIGFRLLLLFSTLSPAASSAGFWGSLSFAENSTMLLRILWLLCEAGTMVLLLRLIRKMGLPDKNVLLYALNPLVILELTLHLHIVAWPILFLTLALYFLYYHRHVFAGAAFGVGVSVLSLPLLFIPLVFRRTGPGPFLVFLGALAAVLLLLYYAGSVQADMQELLLPDKRLDQTFNASLYPVFSSLMPGAGKVLPGYVLPVVLVAISVALAVFRKQNSVRRLAGYMATVLTVYLLLSPAVYPWQLAPLLALTCLSQFRFAIVWSGLLFIALNPGFRQHETALLLLEYAIVFLWLIVEIYFYRQRRKQLNIQKQ